MTEWQINIREANRTLLEALALRVPAAPQAFLRQLCKKQRVTVDGCQGSVEQSVHNGQTVSVKMSMRWLEFLEQSRLQPEQILYEDQHCMVINKPPGLAVHRALGHDDNLLHCIQDFLRWRGETFQVAPIHRLDIGTSGAVLFGKGRGSISQLGKMIMAGEATKRYLALVEGCIIVPGSLTSPVPAKGSSKDALTRFRPFANSAGYTLLELELLTGRHHQIRHQLAEANWPIVGDARYSGKVISGLNRPFLHCYQLVFRQPITDQTIEISCPLPGELVDLLHNLGFATELFNQKNA